MPTPVEVKALANYRIRLRYDDGTAGEVDLSDLAGLPYSEHEARIVINPR